MKENTGFSRDFILVLIGQIISLFGNVLLRFALPLHLLNETGSSTLFGLVSACSFIPIVLMSPVGGLIADRVNKRNIMVVLDFATAGLILSILLLYGRVNFVSLLLVVLTLLYGIAGAYQPAVQASIPLLVKEHQLVTGNAMINTVSSLSGLLGPVLGGILYSHWGILPVLQICVVCFACSAVMEIFIRIPFQKQERSERIWKMVLGDFRIGFQYVVREQKLIGKVMICAALINLALSALLIIGLPVVVTQVLYDGAKADQMLGYLQGILGAGGLAGGLCAGIFGKWLKMHRAWILLLLAGILLIPMGISLLLSLSSNLVFALFAVGSFLIMALATLFTVQMMAFIQQVTPADLIGKVISWVLAVSTCSQPLGQAVYGLLFEQTRGREGVLFLGAAFLSVLIAGYEKKILQQSTL